jgi:hypothetical protein
MDDSGILKSLKDTKRLLQPEKQWREEYQLSTKGLLHWITKCKNI